MAKTRPLVTVAIPAYKRPEEIRPLHESVLSQDFDHFETLVVEDCSPKRSDIEASVKDLAARFPARVVRFEANERNLGFDGNLRQCLALARGEFTLFMGDDDLMRPHALRRLGEVLQKHENLGVVLRAYEQVDFASGQQIMVFRYFAEDRFFPAGVDAIRTFFRRSVSIAGYTVHTESAHAVATDRFDGTLLYQLHLSAQVLAKRDGYYISDILTAMRKDENQRHFFGSAEAERKRFAPSALTPEHSLNFMKGMLEVARAAEAAVGLPIYQAIVQDIGNYSYPFLRPHAKNRVQFLRYVRDLARLGFGQSPYFWGFSGALLVVPVPVLNAALAFLMRSLPATPNLGGVSSGQPVSR